MILLAGFDFSGFGLNMTTSPSPLRHSRCRIECRCMIWIQFKPSVRIIKSGSAKSCFLFVCGLCPFGLPFSPQGTTVFRSQNLRSHVVALTIHKRVAHINDDAIFSECSHSIPVLEGPAADLQMFTKQRTTGLTAIGLDLWTLTLWKGVFH